MKSAIKYILYILFFFCACPKDQIKWKHTFTTEEITLEHFQDKPLISYGHQLSDEVIFYFKYNDFLEKIKENTSDSGLIVHIEDEFDILFREADTIPAEVLQNHLEYLLLDKGYVIYEMVTGSLVNDMKCMIYDKVVNRFVDKVLIEKDGWYGGPLESSMRVRYKIMRNRKYVELFTWIVDS